jgi:pimeloyl-ACP methyl ester carboxylesterase
MILAAFASLALLALVSPALWLLVMNVRLGFYRRHKGVPGTIGVRGFLREWWALIVAGYWLVRGRFADGLHGPEHPVGRPVLVVHGFMGDGTNLWGVRQALEAVGRATIAVSLGGPGRRMATYLPDLERAIGVLADHSPDGIDIVAHSMGGVLVRMVLAAHPELRAVVRHVVTLGSPHLGTAVTRGYPAIGEFQDLGRKSPVIRELPHPTALVPASRWTTIAGADDAVVYPAETCRLDDVDHVELPATGHAGLLVHRASLDAVVRALEAT